MRQGRQGKPGPAGGGAVAFAALLISTWGCGQEAAGEDYPPEVVERFVAACRGADTLNEERAAFCRCVIGKLETRIAFERFADWDRRTTAGEGVPELQAEMRKAGEECRA